jgi:hypothetical protein
MTTSTENGHIPDFDFDGWQRLARESPEEFERQRALAIERVIVRGVDARQLHGMQCRIDMERARARTPMQACLRLSALMWETFHELRQHANAAAGHPGCALDSRKASRCEPAKILPFRRR